MWAIDWPEISAYFVRDFIFHSLLILQDHFLRELNTEDLNVANELRVGVLARVGQLLETHLYRFEIHVGSRTFALDGVAAIERSTEILQVASSNLQGQSLLVCFGENFAHFRHVGGVDFVLRLLHNGGGHSPALGRHFHGWLQNTPLICSMFRGRRILFFFFL